MLPVILFLLAAPYNKNRFVRFHSWQSMGTWLGLVVVVAMLRIVGVALFFIPVLGHLLVWLVSMVVGLAFFMIWIVLMVKAWQGERFALPFVGDFAELQANKI